MLGKIGLCKVDEWAASEEVPPAAGGPAWQWQCLRAVSSVCTIPGHMQQRMVPVGPSSRSRSRSGRAGGQLGGAALEHLHLHLQGPREEEPAAPARTAVGAPVIAAAESSPVSQSAQVPRCL